MRNTEDHTGGQPQVGCDAVLEHLMDEKSAIEKKIHAQLEHMFPKGSRVTYKTDNMKHDRYATVSGSGLYYDHPYISLKPDHALSKPWRLLRIHARYVSVL